MLSRLLSYQQFVDWNFMSCLCLLVAFLNLAGRNARKLIEKFSNKVNIKKRVGRKYHPQKSEVLVMEWFFSLCHSSLSKKKPWEPETYFVSFASSYLFPPTCDPWSLLILTCFMCSLGGEGLQGLKLVLSKCWVMHQPSKSNEEQSPNPAAWEVLSK